MAITAADVKALREATGAGVMEAKRALEAADGDVARATEALRAAGATKAAKKSDRTTGEGIVASYIHGGGQIGALVELACETDFVARNDAFKSLARELAIQVAAVEPESIEALLAQPYVREESKTVGELITDAVASIGEKIKIARFARFAVKGGPSCSVGQETSH